MKWSKCILTCFLMVVVICVFRLVHAVHVSYVTSPIYFEDQIIILDPGHGGVDGGAVSKAGLIEKDVNLSIAQKLRELLELSGYCVVMTREDDRSIHDSDAVTIKEMKSSDIRNRLALMEAYPGSIFVSIHQNHFSQSQYHGSQFFYAPNSEESKILANCLKNAVRNQLQPTNEREIKPCESNVYLIYHATTTAVLAECGFLSNPDEARLLSENEYQEKIAFVLFQGLMDYFSKIT